MTSWRGDAALVDAVEQTLGSAHPVAGVAVVTPEGSMIAHSGADRSADFEIGSVSKPITGMLYRAAVERGLVAETTALGELLPLTGHGAVETVMLGSLATHRSGLPGLPRAMQPVRRTLKLLVRGANPYGETLPELLEQTCGIPVGRARPRYSNLGFQLLGHAVAAAEGRPYRELLGESFGLDLWAPTRESELRPTSLTGVSRLGRPRAAWVGEAVAPAGGIRATTATMRDLLRQVLDGTAPGMSALDPVAQIARGVQIGAGWLTLARADRTYTWHNGATGGFHSWIGLDRSAGVGAVILTAQSRSVDRHGFALVERFATDGGS